MKPLAVLAAAAAFATAGLAAAAISMAPQADPMPPFPHARAATSPAGTSPEELGRRASNTAAFLVAAIKYHKEMKALAETGARRTAIADNRARYEDERRFLVRTLDELKDWTTRTSVDGTMSERLTDTEIRAIDLGGEAPPRYERVPAPPRAAPVNTDPHE